MADLIKKDIRYLSRDFASLKQNLIDFTKNYFPNTYQDFNETSPGMMFLEMAAYVGDVLSYYTDVSLQETFILQASERQNILNIAQSLGYKPKNSIASSVKLDVFQLVPSKTVGSDIVPDFDYAFAIEPGMVVDAVVGGDTRSFRTTDYLDFSFSSSIDPTEITPYEIDDLTKQNYITSIEDGLYKLVSKKKKPPAVARKCEPVCCCPLALRSWYGWQASALICCCLSSFTVSSLCW